MKKTLFFSLLTFICSASAFAQKDVQAKNILAQVSAKYKSYDVVKADFSFALHNPQAGVNETQTGTLLARSKANKFRVTLYSSPGVAAQEIISDGKTQWTYLKKDNEVQVNDVDHSGEGLNPAQVFTIYEHGYKYLYNGDQKLGGKAYEVIDLTPTDANKPFFKVRLMIDKLKKQIYSAELFDKNGSRYMYTVRSLTPNPKITDAAFTFDKKEHPGVEVVDLK